jgi:hypothetical protein
MRRALASLLALHGDSAMLPMSTLGMAFFLDIRRGLPHHEISFTPLFRG